MISKLTTEIKVGLFAIVALGTIGYMFFVLSPDMFENKRYKEYYTVVKDAAGIVPKTHVKTNGVIIGKVKDIQLQDSNTKIVLEIESHVNLPIGSTIAIKEKGLLGDVFVEILRTDNKEGYLKDGSFIPPNESQARISTLIASAGEMFDDLKRVTNSLSNALGGKTGERNIEDIVDNVKQILAETRGLIEENRKDIRKVIVNVEKSTSAVRRIIGDNGEHLDTIVANILKTSDDLRIFSTQIRGLVAGRNSERLENIIAGFDKTMSDVEVTAKNIRLVSEKLENGEGTLGRLLTDDQVILELEKTLKDVRKVIGPATKLQVGVDYHGEVRKEGSTQHYFNTVLRTRPDKFYLLGFTDHSYDEVEETTYRNSTDEKDEEAFPENEGVTKQTKRTVERKAIRYNVQFAKRWHFAQMRFGLFESTGGIATDFFIGSSDRVKLSIEAFDWDNESTARRTAHLKTYASILFFNHIYTVVGVDDPTRLDSETGKVNKDLNYFVGAGLTFNDQDLKALFGTAALAM